jgi:hypothetical protein
MPGSSVVVLKVYCAMGAQEREEGIREVNEYLFW